MSFLFLSDLNATRGGAVKGLVGGGVEGAEDGGGAAGAPGTGSPGGIAAGVHDHVHELTRRAEFDSENIVSCLQNLLS